MQNSKILFLRTLYNYFRCKLQFAICKKKQSLLQDTVLSNSNTASHDFKYMETHLSWKYHQEVLLFPNALNEGMTWAWRCSTFFDCIGCKAIFREKADLLHHATACDSL